MNLNNYQNTKEYNQYLDDLNKYYNIKNKYEEYKLRIKKQIMSKNISIEEKKKEYAKSKFLCINCKQSGGTIFTETNESLSVLCGNINKPCKIELNIKKKNYNNLFDEIIKTNSKIFEIKKNILKIKLDVLFNYISEDKAVELFNNNNSELNKYQEIYYKYLEKYNEITNNKNIDEYIIKKDEIITDINQYYELYYANNDNKYLKDAYNIYIKDLKQIDEKIFNTKYKYYNIEYDEENNNKQLVLKKYLFNDLLFIN